MQLQICSIWLCAATLNEETQLKKKWHEDSIKTILAWDRLSFPSNFFSDSDKAIDELTCKLAKGFCSEHAQLLAFSELPFILDYTAR